MADNSSDTPPRRRRRASASSAPTPPPSDAGKGSGGTSGGGVSPTPPGSPIKTLQGRLEQLFVTPAMVFAARGDQYCAQVIVKGAPDLAESWANLAKESPAVKKVLERLLEGGAWGGVVVSSLMIALPIAQHHGVYPAEWPNPFIPAGMEPPPHHPNPHANGNGNSVPKPFHPEQPEHDVNGVDNGNGQGVNNGDPASGGPFVERVPPQNVPGADPRFT